MFADFRIFALRALGQRRLPSRPIRSESGVRIQSPAIPDPDNFQSLTRLLHLGVYLKFGVGFGKIPRVTPGTGGGVRSFSIWESN